MYPKTIYEKGILFHQYSNAAYPLTQSSFMEYRISDENQISQFLAKYYVNEAICSRYCDTRITSDYFHAIGIDQDTGNSVNDVYSNYTVKYINKNKFFPISIEFWIS